MCALRQPATVLDVNQMPGGAHCVPARPYLQSQARPMAVAHSIIPIGPLGLGGPVGKIERDDPIYC